ncbi:MAG: hypothetical protein PUB05_05860 [Firmicutes bacterium]|nr:hypothetical protein [Bacillota bacterium]
MTKIRFNRLLSVVLALVMLATMMSFVFTANAATTEAKKPINVNNWTDLGLVDAVPNVYNTTVTANASTITGAQGSQYDADYAINACKVFDLSGGFTFTWTMGHSWNNPETYDAVSIGDLTILAKKNSNRTRTLYVVKNGGNNTVQGSIYYGRNPVTAVYGTVLDGVNGVTVPVSDSDRSNAWTYTVTVADGRLSLTVTHGSEEGHRFDNIDVSTIDFSAVTFGIKSAAGNAQGPNNHTNPSLTYYKTIQLVDKSVSTWTALGMADNTGWSDGTTITVTDNAITGSNGTWDGAAYGITASEEFDLSGGFTFTWSMGDNGWNSTETNNPTKNAYNAISIGGITVASQRSGLGDGIGKVYVVKNEEKAEDNSNRVIDALWWQHHTQVGVFGSVLASKTDLAGANNVKAYSLTVSAEGKLSLDVAGTNICSGIDVSDVDFSAATFSVKSGVNYSGGSKYTNPNLTIQDSAPPVSSEDTSSEDTSSEDTSSEDTSSEDTASEDTSSEDTSSEDTSSEDTSSEDTSSEDTSSEDTSSTPIVKGDAPFNTQDWSSLGLTANTATRFATEYAPSCGTATISIPNGQYYHSATMVAGDKYIDLSGGFTVSWNMGDANWNVAKAPTNVTGPYSTKFQIGDLIIIATRGTSSGGEEYTGNAKVYMVKSDEENGDAVVKALAWNTPKSFVAYGTVLGSYDVKNPETETTPYYGNYKRDYSLTVKNGKATLSMNDEVIMRDIDVSDIDFNNVNFVVSATCGYNGGATFTGLNLVAVEGGNGGNGNGGNGNSGNGGNGNSGNGGNGVDSGDTTNLFAFIALAIVAAGGVLLTVRKKSSAR